MHHNLDILSGKVCANFFDQHLDLTLKGNNIFLVAFGVSML